MRLNLDQSEFHAIAIGFRRRMERILTFVLMDEFTAATFLIGPVRGSFSKKSMKIRSRMGRSIHHAR